MARPGRRSGSTGGAAAEETRGRIVEAALATLREEGIVGTSARAIARRGEFNQALIFYHFKTVNDLLLAAVDTLANRRAARYEERLSHVTSLRELVSVAAELHTEDLEEGHMTVLSQVLAGATSAPELRGPLRQRFEPWIARVEGVVTRTLEGTPYAGLVPARDLAFTITALFLGIELLVSLEGDDGAERGVFSSIELLAGMLEAIIRNVPPPAAG